MIQETSRRGHDHVEALSEGVLLGAHAHATVNGLTLEVRESRQFRHVLDDLSGEFPRGRQNQDARRSARLGKEFMENGQQECGGLAAARGRRGQYVNPP